MPHLHRVSSALPMRHNVSWNLGGNVAYCLGNWLQLVILARMGGAAAVGTYAFALALTAPVMVFASLCLRLLLASDAQGAYHFKEYWYLRSATTSLALVAIAVIAACIRMQSSAWLVLLPICVMRAADALSDIYYAVWQRYERTQVIAWALALNAASSLMFMMIAWTLGGGVVGAAVGSALGSCMAFSFIRLRSAADIEIGAAIAAEGIPISRQRVRSLAAEAAPLGFVILLGSLQQNVPRFFIQRYSGQAALGLFVAAAQFTTAAELVGASLAGAAAPRLARLYASDRGSFLTLAGKLAGLAVVLGVAGITLSAVMGRWLLTIFYRPEFASAAHMLVLLSGAATMTLVAALAGYSLSSARVIKVQPVILLASLSILLLTCALFVPVHGAEGASCALLIACTVHALANWIALWHFGSERSCSEASNNLPVETNEYVAVAQQ